jgi:hypothetical protein
LSRAFCGLFLICHFKLLLVTLTRSHHRRDGSRKVLTKDSKDDKEF